MFKANQSKEKGRSLLSERRGSILILVVALLLLVAIIGTSFISTTQSDRYGAVQHNVNTQIDLLVQGVENLETASIVGKLYDTIGGTTTYRSAPTLLSPQYSYRDYESPMSDTYLASRTPELGGTTAYWPAISLPPIPVSPSSTALYQIVAPDSSTPTSLVQIYVNSSAIEYNKGDVVVLSSSAVPQVFYVAGSGGSGQSLGQPGYNVTTKAFNANWTVVDPKKVFQFIPCATTTGQAAIEIYNNVAGAYLIPPTNAQRLSGYTTAYSATANNFLAADADGDGIADSLLFKLPVGQVDGVSYFAAARVLDENSAVNASIASSALADTDFSSPPKNSYRTLGVFRSNIGLQEMLSGGGTAASEINQLNFYRIGGTGTYSAATNYTASSTPYTGSTSQTARNYPTAPDFYFQTQGEAFEEELANRPLNPGYNASSGQPFQFLGNTATAALARRYCLRPTSTSATELENDLSVELDGTLGQANPYGTADVNPSAPNNAGPGTWYTQNFNFTAANDPVMPLRTVLVGSNPVANAVSGHYTYRNTYAPGTTYNFGDWVTAANGACYVCIQAGVAPDPSTIPPANSYTNGLNVAANAYWEFVPWTSVPVKISANTAPFGQLWAAYWNAMYDHASPAGGFAQPEFGFPLTSTDTNTNQVANQNIPVPSVEPVGTYTPLARMFRSPIRDPNNNSNVYPPSTPGSLQYLTPGQTMLLRSALAALNTESLRRASGSANPSATGLDDVLTRGITIPADPADGNSKAYQAMLFGATKQPYISEVYVEMGIGGATNALAIELSNPYSTPMVLTNWQIAWMSRSTSTYSTGTPAGPAMTLGTGTALPTETIPAATAAGPGKFIFYSGSPAGTLPTASPMVGIQQVPGLATAVGEIVLLRPRKASGAASSNTTDLIPENQYNEGAGTTYSELVPVDQIDTGGLAASTDYDYRRATNSNGCAWNFVYSGGYSFVPAVAPYRHVGWLQVAAGTYALGQDKTAYAGAAMSATSASFQTVPIQIANTDSAGWNQTKVSGNAFPFGGFARDGDLLQVPFIGAYRILLAPPKATVPTTAATAIVEMNSLPMDSAFADDQDALDDMAATANAPTTNLPFPTVLQEQLGRFCPIRDFGDYPTPDSPPAVESYPDDSLPASTPMYPAVVYNSNPMWRYHWANKLFDFISVHPPSDDYLPNTDPINYVLQGGTLPTGISNRQPSIVNAQTLGSSEDTVPIEGLININTAPVEVLARLPIIPTTCSNTTDTKTYTYTDASGITNFSLAQAIVNYRLTYGPFKSLFDLYKVPLFEEANSNLAVWAASGTNWAGSTPADRWLAAGDFSPYTPITAGDADNVRYDFEERYLLLNRISNLITTRSDSFTCYVLVQGWRNVGSSNPTLVAQRRAAFILDRSSVTPNNPAAYTTFPISQN